MRWLAVRYVFWGLMSLLLEFYRRSPVVVLASLLIWWPLTAVFLLTAHRADVHAHIVAATETEMAWNTARGYKPGWATKKKLALIHELR